MLLPNCEGNRYTNLGLDVLKALAKNQLANGTIYDKIDNSNTPDDHYAHTFFALAALLSSRYQNTCGEAAEKALEYFTHIPDKKRGHHEFNILACLLIREILKQGGVRKGGLPSLSQLACFDLLTNYIKKTPFEARANTSHGNNWVVIQALILMLRYHHFKAIADFQRANRLIDHYVFKWQLPDGVFYDAPRSPSSKYVETPLTYHAKFCMILSLYAQISNRCDVYQAVLRGLDAHSKLVSPNGEGFYFGRTNNAIFGYASALYAYETMIQYLLSSKEKDERIAYRMVIYRQTADVLFSYLKAMQDRDGYLRCTPGSIGIQKAGWDSYMHHTVYNSYASALLLMTPYTKVPKRNYPRDKKVSVDFLENSGFLAVKHKRSFLVMNVKGQSGGSRYAGMIPLIWYVEGKDLLPSPPTRKEDDKNGFTPVVITKGVRYVPTVWRNAHIINNNYGITVFSEGELTGLSKLSISLIEGLIPKPSAIAFNFLQKTGLTKIVNLARAQRKEWFCAQIPFRLYRGIIFSNNGHQIFIVDTLKATTKIRNVTIIPPSVLLPTTSVKNLNLQGRKLFLHLRKVNLDFKFEILSPPINHFDQTSHLDTSKGSATLLTPQAVFLPDLEDTFHSVALLQADKKRQEPDYKITAEKDVIIIHEDSAALLSVNTVNRTIEVHQRIDKEQNIKMKRKMG